MIAFVIVLLLVIVGVQSWKVVGSIVNAERVAVVPLPTTDPSLARVLSPTMVPIFASPPGSPGATPSAASGTPVPSDGTGVLRTPIASATPSPKASASAYVAAVVSPTPKAKSTASADTASTDNPSQIDIVKDIVSAGTDNSDPGKSSVWGGKTSLNVLIIGIDTRAQGGDQNADVLIIAHVDLINKRVAAVSIPRDLYVTIPGIGADKVNSSYNWGIKDDPKSKIAGVTKVRDTIESDFGIPIDGYVLFDFAGFKQVVDAMGGVDIDVPNAIEDDAYPTSNYGTMVVKFRKGLQHMDGARALEYVRTRHADSDDARRQRQLQVMLALFDKGKDMKSISNAGAIIDALGKTIQTSFTLQQQLTFARLALETDRDNIRLSSLEPPLLQAGYTAAGAWIYTGDMGQIISFVQDGLKTDASEYKPNATPDPFGA